LEFLRCVLASAGLLLALAATAAEAVSEEVIVSGAVKTPLTLKLEDLKGFPQEQIGSVSITRRVDDKDATSIVRGVRLTAVLERASLLSADHNDWKHTIVVATATDGYRVVFSWPELFNSDAGTSVLVVFERDGQPLADREGHIALVSGRDLRTGPRSVKWLSRLDVRVLKE
jgi:DMSO/TMAO reductase YedYZ molybdopterin-dependent catalytic subunit